MKWKLETIINVLVEPVFTLPFRPKMAAVKKGKKKGQKLDKKQNKERGVEERAQTATILIVKWGSSHLQQVILNKIWFMSLFILHVLYGWVYFLAVVYDVLQYNIWLRSI